jgi:putative aldouronate transport system substrate-binding protein
MLRLKAIMTLLICVGTIGLSGCGTKDSKNSSDNTIHWYMRKPIETMDQQDLVEKEANKIINEKIGANLKFHFFDNASWDDKMNVLISSGEEFDICFTASWTNKFLNNAQRGAFIDHKALLEKYGQDIMKKSANYAWGAATINGKIFAIPGQGPYSTARSLVFKKEFVDKYKFDYKSVKSLSDLEPYLEMLKKNELSITPLLNVPEKVSDVYSDNSVPGLIFNEEKQEYEIAIEIKEQLDLYKLKNNYYKKGYIAKDAATITDYTSEAKTGKYAVLMNTGDYTADGSKTSATYGYPCVEAYFGNEYITNGTITSAMNAISATSKKPEKSMQLLNLIWQDPNLSNTLAYGIEGTNYTVNTSKNGSAKSVIPKSGKEQTWAIWHNWVGPLFDQWDSTWNSTERLQQMQEANKKGRVSQTLGFAFNIEPVKAEVAQISAIAKETKSVLAAGSMSDFNEYIKTTSKKYADAGIAKVKEEANKQFKEWVKSKK